MHRFNAEYKTNTFSVEHAFNAVALCWRNRDHVVPSANLRDLRRHDEAVDCSAEPPPLPSNTMPSGEEVSASVSTAPCLGFVLTVWSKLRRLQLLPSLKSGTTFLLTLGEQGEPSSAGEHFTTEEMLLGSTGSRHRRFLQIRQHVFKFQNNSVSLTITETKKNH